MPPLRARLRLVERPRAPARPPAPALGDLALVAALCALNLVPILGELAHAGRFGAGTLGLATAVLLVAGRELCAELASVGRERLGRPLRAAPAGPPGRPPAALPDEPAREGRRA